MKLTLATLALAAITTTATAQTVTLVAHPPPSANITQPFAFNPKDKSVPDGVQARYRSSGSDTLSSLIQTFTWNTGERLTAIGIMVSPGQNAPGGCVFAREQDYALDVQELASAGRVAATIATVTVALTPAVVQPGKYIQITPASPLPLVRGKTYGFHLRPIALVRANRLLIAYSGKTGEGGRGRTGPENPAVGGGNQVSGHYDAAIDAYTAFPIDARYTSAGGGGYTLTFYTTAGNASDKTKNDY
jgi:hypothetical protein